MSTLNEYDFFVPKELIACRPINKREDSRLLVLKANDKSCAHDQFVNIVNYLNEGDALVINNAKVMRARLIGHKESGAKIELLLIRPLENKLWLSLIKGLNTYKKGTKLIFIFGIITVEEKIMDEAGAYIISFDGDLKEQALKYGEIPLPPYMQRFAEEIDYERYQTIYANDQALGAVAAPTAGLHFSKNLLLAISNKGVKIVEVTLNVGPGTFLPIRSNDLSKHKMHKEFYELNEEAAYTLNEVKQNNSRIIAVGTTSMRVLEQSMFNSHLKGFRHFIAEKADTSLFIKPKTKFLAVDALITNFHLPRSTLFLLVAAVLGKERALASYDEAVKEKYRFFSYGDACFFEVVKGE